MAITSTKSHLASVTGRLFKPRTVSSTSVFRGALNPVFLSCVKSGWGRTGQSHFGPVAKEFYKPVTPLYQFESPRANPVGHTTYTFSPTIRLAFFPGAWSNSAFRASGRQVFQTFPTRSSQSAAGLRGSLMQPTPQTVNARGTTLESRGAAMFVVARGSGEVRSSVEGSRPGAVARVLLTTVAHPTSITSVTKYVNDVLRADDHSISDYGPRVEQKYLHPVFAVGRSAASSSQLALTRNKQGLSDPHATPSLPATPSDAASFSRVASVLGSVTSVAMDFANPKVANVESVNKRLAHFVSAPAMTYAKPKQDTSEGVLQALRDLRTSQPEQNTAVAPQWPSIQQLTNEVKTQLERDLRIEKERRGL
jgi:hypothetical protein